MRMLLRCSGVFAITASLPLAGCAIGMKVPIKDPRHRQPST